MSTIRPIFISLCFTFSVVRLVAQDLPHQMTLEEQKVMAGYLREKYEGVIRVVPNPPAGQVRTMAEWEQIQALIITWSGQQAILREIVRHAVKECKVLIITTNPNSVATQLTGAGILLDSVQFVNTPFNSIWVRDYGPWAIYQNDVDSLALVDWIYNRPRQNDDASPVAIAQHLNLPIYEATTPPYDWVHTGGNHLPDGMGTVFSSMLVLEENPDKTEAQIDSIANLFLGVNRYIKFPTLPYDGIHHLDMHMRVIDEETILFGQYPEGVSDGPQIESNIQYLTEEFQTAFGNTYNIQRLPMPPDGSGRYPNQGGAYRTYTNSVFVNKTILVPVYEEKYDTTALRIYRENLPGYNVVGINCNSIIGSLGAIHCITKSVGVADPLWIAHAKLRDAEDESLEYPVIATIKHRFGIAGAEVFYRIAPDTVYHKVPMVLVDSLAHTWGAIIPPQEAGSEIQYYIHAEANNGKEQVRPIVAPEGYFRFRVKGDVPNALPTVQILEPVNFTTFSNTLPAINIAVEAADTDGEIVSLQLFADGVEIDIVDTSELTASWTHPGDGEYNLYAVATDNHGAVTISDTVHIIITDLTSTQPLSSTEECQVYPNPVTDVMKIACAHETGSLRHISVMDMQGREMPVAYFDLTGVVEVDVFHIPPGIYSVVITFDDASNVYRVVKR